MHAKLYASLLIIPLLATQALAAPEKQKSEQSGGLLQGTPEEQAACAPDSTKFCRDAIPDNFRVLACLQEHRKRLRKACLKVLEDHGR
ncbi:MAG TPA: cysteine rich repeat-containing protein [Pseudolabrys sp.]|nr:cysteine rich repeat-containing protein [Pseudolabrys sp.]